MIERRNYKNGFGRRPYDKGFCPFYDADEHKCKEVESLKEDLKSKMPWSIFALFVTSMIAIAGILLNYQFNTSEKTLDLMIELKKETSRIEAKQELIMDHIRRDDSAEVKNSFE